MRTATNIRNGFLILLSLLLGLILARQISASVIINEFTTTSPQAVELLNTASMEADISGFYLDDSGGNSYVTLPQSIILPAGACYVVRADLNLNTASSDTIRLFTRDAPPTSSSAKLLHAYTYSTGNSSGYSYGLAEDTLGPLTQLLSSFGYLNKTGSVCEISPTPSPSPTAPPLPLPSTSPQAASTVNEGVYISELMPQGDEWVELYNHNDKEVSLINWNIDDTEGAGSAPKKFSVTIPAKGYVALAFSSMFNNDGDTVRLINEAGTVLDTMEYTKSSPSLSFTREEFEGDTWCLASPTKGAPNAPCAPSGTTAATSSTGGTTAKTPSSKKKDTAKALAPKKTYAYMYPQAPLHEEEGDVLGDAYFEPEALPAGKPVPLSSLLTLLIMSSVTAKHLRRKPLE